MYCEECAELMKEVERLKARLSEVQSNSLLDAGNSLAKEAAALIVAVRSELARSTLHGRRGVVQTCGDLSTLIARWDDASNSAIYAKGGKEC